MMIQRLAFLLIFLSLSPRACAQGIGLYGLEKIGERGISLHYQNDAFGNTDYYYSQGVQLAASIPVIQKTSLSKLLPSLNNSERSTGIALEHDAYTPTSILSDSILQGDRPYAASAILQLYGFSRQLNQHAQLSALLSVGIIGPAAGGEEIQAGIHRNTNNDIPHGWQYQVQNDLILNYTLTYERNLFRLGNFFFADALGGIAIGTYSNKAFAGIDLKTGLLNHPLFELQKRSFHLYLEDRGTIQLVGYDATMQGGLFNRNSPYTISASAINRLVFKNTLALNIDFKQCTLSGNYTWLSQEFSTGKSHAWGGLQVAYRF